MEIFVSTDNFIKEIPNSPGVYRFYAQNLANEYEILYVGKALNLQRRIKSYFQKCS